jgi:hypothetical protein
MENNMKKQKEIILCNNIVLYDLEVTRTTFEEYFKWIQTWAEKTNIPWEAIGLPQAKKLILFKNGKRRLEKNGFGEELDSLELYGGGPEPGTNENWLTYSSIEGLKKGEIVVSFVDFKLPFQKEVILSLLKDILQWCQPKYGIIYQRDYEKGPYFYASGCICGIGHSDAELIERSKISNWSKQYRSNNGAYRTGLLRDVYPFNLLIDIHLGEKVGKSTLEAWINSDPKHGALEKITDTHWLWSIEPEHIPIAQEALQEAGLLLCYKV